MDNYDFYLEITLLSFRTLLQFTADLEAKIDYLANKEKLNKSEQKELISNRKLLKLALENKEKIIIKFPQIETLIKDFEPMVLN